MSLLSGIFSDLFARQDNTLARLDARTKLIVALAMLAAVIFSTTPVFPLGILLVCVTAAAALGVPARLLALRLAAPLGIAGMLLVLQSVMAGSTPLWSAALLGVKITVTREGLHNGLLIASRVLGGVSVMLLLSSVTPAHRIFGAMRALGAPQGWVEIAMLMYRYTFVLLELTGDVTSAQKVRLGYAGMRRGLASAGTLGGTVLLRSMDQAVRTHEAMRVRGYSGEIPFGPMPKLARRDGWIVAVAALALGTLFYAAEALCP
ncbi:MAG: cobalt ECF transporter T component CbiQ [Chthoniobacteraceae bacterium]|nr:cobalt ECF transporter T component CbiQ [Chthoniobacteraceae bacterium]